MSALRKLVLVWTLWVVVAVGVAAVAGGGAAAGRAGSVPPYDHIMVVVEENHGFGDVIGNPAAPNLNYLAKTFGLATEYRDELTTMTSLNDGVRCAGAVL